MSFKSRAARASTASKLIASIAILSSGTLLQACSANRDQGDGSSWKLWGSSDKSQETAAKPQPSTFDTDGPPSRGSDPVYRGGRDPVTGRANDWPPATPPRVESAALPPVSAPAQPSYPSSGYPSSGPVDRSTNLPSQTAYAPSARPAIAANAAPQAAAATSVEVRPGETLYRIAKANNVTVPALMQANGLTTETIKAGQKLNIPGR